MLERSKKDVDSSMLVDIMSSTEVVPASSSIIATIAACTHWCSRDSRFFVTLQSRGRRAIERHIASRNFFSIVVDVHSFR
jgi:hypothetical protein